MVPTWKILSPDAGQNILVEEGPLLDEKSLRAIAMVLMVRADIPLADLRDERRRPDSVNEDVIPSIEIPTRSGSKRKRGGDDREGGKRAKGTNGKWASTEKASPSEPITPCPEDPIVAECCYFQSWLLYKPPQEFEEIIRRLVGHIFDACFGCWAAQRIVCIDNHPRGKAPTALADIAEVDLQGVTLPKAREYTHFRKLLVRHIQRSEYEDKASLETILENEISRIGNERYPRGETWVLLDWTTISYRRASGDFQSQLPTDFEANIDEIAGDLGRLVLSHICWLGEGSNRADMSLSGKWIGHRFSITTMKRFKKYDPDYLTWTDVSG